MATDDDETFAPESGVKDEADEHDESEEELEADIASGAKDADPYTEEGREKLEEDDEAKPGEVGYAKGSVGGKRHGELKARPPQRARFKPKR